MNKTRAILLGALLTTGCLVAGGASASFMGYYDPGDATNDYLNWTLTETRDGSLEPTTGGVDTSAAPTSITIEGQDDNLTDPDGGTNAGRSSFTIPIPTGGSVSFYFEYTNGDDRGDPGNDSFGYLINDMATAVVDESTDPTTGTISFSVAAGDVVGWYHDTVDNAFGEAYTVISNFRAPGLGVPVPATLALLGFGLLIPAVRRRV